MNPLRFIQITDTHLFDRAEGTLRGVNTAESLAVVVAHIRARLQPIDGILATGDLSHDGGTPSYRRLIHLLRPLNASTYCLPGNHDALGVFGCTLKGTRVQSGGRLLRDDWQLIFLDSALPGAVHGRLRQRELERLDAALAEQPQQHALVCLHHQPVPVGSAWLDKLMLDNAAALFDVLDRHPQVRGLLWGHVHQAYDAMRHQVRLLSGPASCIQFKPDCEEFTLDDLPPGYRWLELYADGHIETGIDYADLPA